MVGRDHALGMLIQQVYYFCMATPYYYYYCGFYYFTAEEPQKKATTGTERSGTDVEIAGEDDVMKDTSEKARGCDSEEEVACITMDCEELEDIMENQTGEVKDKENQPEDVAETQVHSKAPVLVMNQDVFNS